MKPDDEKRISQILERWEESPEPPPAFRSGVWTKIAARQDRRENSPIYRLVSAITGQLARPAFAVSTAGVALLLSVAVAHVHAAGVSAEHRAEAESQYLASISPLLRVSADGQTFTGLHDHE